MAPDWMLCYAGASYQPFYPPTFLLDYSHSWLTGERGGGGLIKFGARPVRQVSASAMNSAYQPSEVI